MEKEYIFFNEQFVEAEKAMISVKTNSLHYGTAIFEGIRAYWNEEKKDLFLLFGQEHYTRLIRNAKSMFMNIGYTPEELVDITLELLRKNNIKEDVYIRPLVYFSDLALTPKLIGYNATITIYTYKFGKYLDTSKGIRVQTSSWVRNDDNSIPSRWKVAGGYVNSALAKTEAILSGFDEAVMLNSAGYVSEGSGENIFIVRNGKIITPEYSDHILEGITRNAVKQLANDLGIPFEERKIARSELYAADEIFMTGTAAEVTPVIEIDHRKVSNGEIGNITKLIQENYFNAVRGNDNKYRNWLKSTYN